VCFFRLPYALPILYRMFLYTTLFRSLAIYAYKCGVSKQQLRQDMKEAFDDLQMVKHENALTEEDIRSALEAYDKEYYNFTISDRSEEHTSELQSRFDLVCRLLLEKKN